MVRARATALEKGLNTVLNPLLAEVEDMLTEGHEGYQQSTDGRGEDDRRLLSWGTASLADLPYLLSAACGALADRGPDTNIGTPASIREATSAMLLVLHAICIAGEEAQVWLPCSMCPVSLLSKPVLIFCAAMRTFIGSVLGLRGLKQPSDRPLNAAEISSGHNHTLLRTCNSVL
jgi:hypothetical protein